MSSGTMGQSGPPDPRWAIMLDGRPASEIPPLPDVPEAAASSLYVTDVSNVRTVGDLLAVITVDFSVPGPMGDLNAVLSRLSDIDWAPNPAGYVWQVRGLQALRTNNHILFQQMVRVWIHLCDRGRSRLVPFRILVDGDEATLSELKGEVAQMYQGFRDSPWKVDFEEPAVLERVEGDWRSAFPLE